MRNRVCATLFLGRRSRSVRKALYGHTATATDPPARRLPMIVGSGLIARAMSRHFHQDYRYVVYAAGVSNSNCTEAREFDRERLKGTIACLDATQTLIYLSTCSVYDSDARQTLYVRHKLAME